MRRHTHAQALCFAREIDVTAHDDPRRRSSDAEIIGARDAAIDFDCACYRVKREPFAEDIPKVERDAPGKRLVQLTRDGREVARFNLPQDLPPASAFFVSEGQRIAYTAHGSKIAATDLSR